MHSYVSIWQLLNSVVMAWSRCGCEKSRLPPALLVAAQQHATLRHMLLTVILPSRYVSSSGKPPVKRYSSVLTVTVIKAKPGYPSFGWNKGMQGAVSDTQGHDVTLFHWESPASLGRGRGQLVLSGYQCGILVHIYTSLLGIKSCGFFLGQILSWNGSSKQIHLRPIGICPL